MGGEAVDVANVEWDVVVVGAGPAGSTAARLLAERGLGVLLVDRAKFPRNKVCGCCLNGAALRALNGTGIGGTLRNLGAVPLNSLELRGYGRRVRIALPVGRVLSRGRLDAGLIRNARRAGARFLQNSVATLLGETGDGWEVGLRLRTEDAAWKVAARAVVCADGLDGRFLKRHPMFAPEIAPGSRIGLGLVVDGEGSELEEGQIRMVVDPEGYVGMVRLEDGRLDVAAAVDRDALRTAGPSELLTGILARNGGLYRTKLEGSIHGTPALTRRHKVRAGTRLFLLGDAAGYVEPFTGEGIAWAVSSAVLAAPLVAHASRDWHPDLAHDWDTLYQRSIGRRQSIIRCLASVLKRPTLSRSLLGAIQFLPGSARPFVTRLNRTVTER